MNFAARGHGGMVDLQATLAAASASASWEAPIRPHHPITCSGDLRLEVPGPFSCEHSSAPAADVRTQLCIDHSIAILLIELSREL